MGAMNGFGKRVKPMRSEKPMETSAGIHGAHAPWSCGCDAAALRVIIIFLQNALYMTAKSDSGSRNSKKKIEWVFWGGASYPVTKCPILRCLWSLLCNIYHAKMLIVRSVKSLTTTLIVLGATGF